MSSRRFLFSAIALTLCLLMLFAMPTIIIDPFFHYHAPYDNVSYYLSNERYQNDGILRHFEYDSIIIGSSMSQCFKTSEYDALFGASSVKVPLAGAYLREFGDHLRAGFESDNDIKRVLLSLDLFSIMADKDAVKANYDYPYYLYDDNIFNDVRYVLNKEVFFSYTYKSISSTLAGIPSDTFDEYSNWSDKHIYGKDKVMSGYQRSSGDASYVLDEYWTRRVRDNLEQNLLSLVRAHRDTEFVCFIPPYSIAKLCTWYEQDSFDYCFGIYELTADMLLSEENVRVFSFYDNYEMICDLDNYRDTTHYGGWVNTYILESIKDNKHELHLDGVSDYFDSLSEYYRNYDYSDLLDQSSIEQE